MKKILFATGVCFLTCSAFSLSTKAAAPMNGLVGYWAFDEGSGTIATDSSGNGNPGTLVNSPAWAAGKFNSAVAFDGTNPKYVDLGNPGSLSNLPAFTWSFWAYVPNAAASAQPVLEIGAGSALVKAVYFGTSSGGSPGQIVAQVGAGTTQAKSVTVNNTYTTGTWQHWAITYDNAGDRTLHIYKNGGEVAYASQTAAVGTETPEGSYHWSIGATPSTQFSKFSGTIDELRIYNRVLSAQEIVDDYNDTGLAAGSSPPPPSGDTTPPTITISSPSSGATLSGTAPITANAADNVGVASVSFNIDGSTVSTDTSAPYTYSWDTTATSNGSHSISATAKDTAGNTTVSPNVTVAVSNTVPAADTASPSVPTGLTAAASSYFEVNLSWTPSTDNVGVAGYKLYRGGSQIGTTGTNSFLDNGVSAGASYSYTVSAYDAAGNNSAQSAAATVTTPTVSPPSTPPPSGAPIMYYEDLNSGPKTGGENNLGVFVTINGKNFGASQGTSALTLGGGNVTVKSWSDNKIVFQPGPGGNTGAISVTVNGQPSTCAESGNCNFTVRTGNIYCVSNSGSDALNGKFTSEPNGAGCWKTLAHSINKLNPGDTLYFGSGPGDTFQSAPNDPSCKGGFTYGTIRIVPGYGCGKSGTASNPVAIVGYPGNSATIGGQDGTAYGMQAIFFNSGGGLLGYWTVANLRLIGSSYNFNNGAVVQGQGKGYRLVNLDIQLPLAPQSYEGGWNLTNTLAIEGEGIVNRMYGLYIHNINIGGTPGDTAGEASKHATLMYQGSDGNEQEIAWSVLDGTPQNGLGSINRCYHNHSSPGTGPGNPIWGVHFHDNIVLGCAGNTLDATIDPGKGSGVDFYNNVIYDTGTGENWVGYTRGYSIFGLQLGTEGDYNWLPDSGIARFYNNTIYNINSAASPTTGDGMTGGLFYGPSGLTWGSCCSAPPPPVTICSSSCTSRTYSGTLPPTKYTPYYFPKSVAFQDAISNVDSRTQNVVDDGNGNLTEEAQVIGTINYATGAYNFTLLRNPVFAGTVKYFTIRAYRVLIQDNIFYLKSGEPVFFTYGAGLQQFEMDHNLFYNEGGTGPGLQPTWPIKVTNPVGNNSNPMFTDPAHGDFSLQPGSPAIGAGIDLGYGTTLGAHLGTIATAGTYTPPPPIQDATPPTKPSGLSATPVSASEIDLTWIASTDNIGVIGYKVYRNGSQIATAITNSFTDIGLPASTSYTYTVAAYDLAGNISAQSSPVFASTLAAGTSGIPTPPNTTTTPPVNPPQNPGNTNSPPTSSVQPTPGSTTPDVSALRALLVKLLKQLLALLIERLHQLQAQLAAVNATAPR